MVKLRYLFVLTLLNSFALTFMIIFWNLQRIYNWEKLKDLSKIVDQINQGYFI